MVKTRGDFLIPIPANVRELIPNGRMFKRFQDLFSIQRVMLTIALVSRTNETIFLQCCLHTVQIFRRFLTTKSILFLGRKIPPYLMKV